MKIVLINNLYYPWNKGGAEKIVAGMACKYRGNGDEINIITTRPWFQPAPADDDTLYLGSLFYYLNLMPKILRLIWHFLQWLDFITAWRIFLLIRRLQADLVITHNLTGLSWLTPWMLGRRKVQWWHYLHDLQLLHPSGLLMLGQEKKFKSAIAGVYRTGNRFFFRKVGNIIAPTEWIIDEHKKFGFFMQTPSTVFPPQLWLGLKPAGHFVPLSESSFNFLFVGQMEMAKGVFLLLEAFKMLSSRFGKINLFLAGDGSQLKNARRLSTGLPVKFFGRLSGAHLQKFWQTGQALIVPSLCYENAPNVIFEAIAYSIPFIVADLGGLNELAVKYSGTTFRAGDARNLAEVMNSIYVNYPVYSRQMALRNMPKSKSDTTDTKLFKL